MRLGVADRVTITGVVDRDEVPRIASAFDIAIQTALVPYASPICLIEYLGLGLAILAPDQPNHTELLRNGVDAVLYDPVANDGLEKGLDLLCADDALRDQLSQRGPLLVEERRLKWTDHADVVLQRAAAVRRASPLMREV